jgi:glycosyltransferase involved in cell wall biosynthesis
MSKKNRFVTVIINCFNGEEYIEQAIKSVIAQSYDNFELVIYDNKSTDRTREIIKSFSDNRIKLFSAKRHVGLGQARNEAIRLSRGDFYAFLDSDDLWKSEKLKLQMKFFEDFEVGIVISNCIYKSEENERLSFRNPIKTDFHFKNLFLNYFITFSSVILRKSALDFKNPIFDESMTVCEDTDLLLKITARWKLACANKPLTIYRMHPESLTSKKPFLFVKESGLAFHNLLNYLKNSNQDLFLWAKDNALKYSPLISSQMGIFYYYWKLKDRTNAIKSLNNTHLSTHKKLLMSFVVFIDYKFFLKILRLRNSVINLFS